MDPRLKLVLLTLLDLALESQATKAEQPAADGRDPRYWLKQLQPPGTHITKPFQVTNFGGA